MLATRATRSIHSGGGARERNVFCVMGSGGVVDDGQGIIGRSWSMGCQQLKFAVVVCTLLPVPG